MRGCRRHRQSEASHAVLCVSDRQRLRRGAVRRESARRVRGRPRHGRRDDAGAGSAVQPVGEHVCSAVRAGNRAGAHLYADVRNAVRRTPDTGDRTRRADSDARRRRHHARNARRNHPGRGTRRCLDAAGESAAISRGGGDARRPRGDAGAGGDRRRAGSCGAAALGRHGIRTTRDPTGIGGRGAPDGAPRRSPACARPHGPEGDGLCLCTGFAIARPGRRPRDRRALLLSQARSSHRGSWHGLGVRKPRRLADRYRREDAATDHDFPGRCRRSAMPTGARGDHRPKDSRVRARRRDRPRNGLAFREPCVPTRPRSRPMP